MRRRGLMAMGALCVLCLCGGLSAAWAGQASGKAAFESRTTVVPLSVCDGVNCPRPEPYWVLVLSGTGTKYELDAMFARGSRSAPESITVAGVEISVGSDVVLDGNVEPIGSDYALVTDVRSAGLLREAAARLLWTCNSAPDARPQLRVEVWRQNDPDGVYAMQIFAFKQERMIRVDSIDFVSVTRGGAGVSETVFSGAKSLSAATLTLDRKASVFGRTPATLSYSRDFAGPYLSVPFEISQRMTCDSSLLWQ